MMIFLMFFTLINFVPFNYGIPYGNRRSNLKNGSGILQYGRITFPDPVQIITKIETRPKCAKGDGATYCEDLESYPSEIVSNIIKDGEVDVHNFVVDETPEEMDLRFDRSDNFLCNARQRMIFPKIGKNKKNEWKYIINQPDNEGYVQGVRIELCYRPGSPCNLISDLIQGYKTTCVQKFVHRRLVALSDNGLPEVDLFPLPSACCCAYKRDIKFLSQFGSPFSPSRNG